MKTLKQLVAGGVAIALLSAGAVDRADAATYYMTADETTNSATTSFNSSGNWNAGGVPAAGNGYYTAYLMRTPNNANANNTFAGDSLRLDAGGLLALTPSQNGTFTITVSNLILNGGAIAVYRGDSHLILAAAIIRRRRFG
jgi:hypothetical protein